MFKELLDNAFNRAKENGDFDDLPGSGKPIEPSKLNTDPFAKAYGESEAMTPFGIMQRKTNEARERLAAETDPDKRKAIQTEISMLETRKAIEMETWRRYS